MSDGFTHCPFCGRQLYSSYGTPGVADGSDCPGCGKKLPASGTRVHVDIAGLSTAVNAQAGAAASMLTALARAQALPLVSLLESWWEKLTETDKDAFVKALLIRAMHMVHQGKIDDRLTPIVLERFDNATLAKRLEQLIEKGGGDDALTNRIATIVGNTLERDGVIVDEMKETVRQVVRECVMNQREVIEAAVRDKMPEIEEMTRDIVKGIADDMAEDVRARMRRKD